MNKHAKNLRTMITLLPVNVSQAYRDTIYSAVAEIDRLDAVADRYQYLRTRDLDTIDQGGIFVGQTPQNIVINGEDLDREIDQAIAKEAI